MRRNRAAVATALTLLVGCGLPNAGSPTGTVSPSTPSGAPRASATAVPTPDAAVTLLVDTDAATDDLVAISFLVASPSVTIKAITVTGTGEAHCAAGVSNVLRLLERLDAPAIPVACGRETPLAGDHAFPDLFRSGADAAGGLELPATDRRPVAGDAVSLLLDTAAAVERPVRLLTLGPLTNVAMALQADPSFKNRIESTWIMGGAVGVPGNVAGSPGVQTDNTAAEWNVYADPAAAAAVLDSGMAVHLISLDGTNQVPVTVEYAARVAAATGAPSLGILQELFAKNAYMTDGTYYLWDPLAAIFAAGYPVGSFTAADLTVDTSESSTSGATRTGEGQADAG